MQWRLEHSEVALGQGSEVLSKSTIYFEHNGQVIELISTEKPENHVLGAKRVLVDTANQLENLARDMKKRADSLR
jgi:hypothetical protein